MSPLISLHAYPPSSAPSHTGQRGDQHSFLLRNVFPITGLAGTHLDERLESDFLSVAQLLP